uniref:Uncharacterized protein n=1 Tax=Arundo donax TaxID=35708 RepID=A0A0A9H527_ARUDO
MVEGEMRSCKKIGRSSRSSSMLGSWQFINETSQALSVGTVQMVVGSYRSCDYVNGVC